MNEAKFEALRDKVIAGSALHSSYHHGEQHWRAVALAGLELLAATPAADPETALLFALCHDARRENEWDNPDHRRRGVDLALLNSPGVSSPTQGFIEQWFEVAKIGGAVADDRRARSLISNRERVKKRSQARLHNRRALELWGGSSGTAQLSYRWPIVERMVNDILKGIATTQRASARA
jgi:hypothetical protein